MLFVFSALLLIFELRFYLFTLKSWVIQVVLIVIVVVVVVEFVVVVVDWSSPRRIVLDKKAHRYDGVVLLGRLVPLDVQMVVDEARAFDEQVERHVVDVDDALSGARLLARLVVAVEAKPVRLKSKIKYNSSQSVQFKIRSNRNAIIYTSFSMPTSDAWPSSSRFTMSSSARLLFRTSIRSKRAACFCCFCFCWRWCWWWWWWLACFTIVANCQQMCNLEDTTRVRRKRPLGNSHSDWTHFARYWWSGCWRSDWQKCCCCYCCCYHYCCCCCCWWCGGCFVECKYGRFVE